MTIRLFRVDERLIHGQVVVGWGRRLGIERILVVSDELAHSSSERELYRSGLPSSMRAEFLTVAEAVETAARNADPEASDLLLTEDLETMTRLVEAGMEIEEVNIGGIYAGPDRERVLSYVYLDDEDEGRVRRLEAGGVRVVARDVPGGPPVRIAQRVS